ncbi:translation initiation factor IF-2 [Candidatus Adlerbacteria bacterium RIFCSPHIGHO2_12_FULL_53_18]|uniref:Translation initiation factor IF-2 n=1 Tax=Candidatus Adlerbacteria bacterium RIFCSPHIGHO2_12_FULL_53_18 TaxID=1797242 RepID=A0A1F4XSJ7_9BACT|nr:MAG: translation initiation factor IF-2 [Candidatus Adlerbacteria bacterium RIFCSPHIGHO2_12_FULL_53_18]
MTADKAIGGLRPPVVAIVGHIDHGKSTLLDYIRKTNVALAEAGGITQHLSAYEAMHLPAQAGKNEEPRKITFLDTPGHEAFTAMRSRGLEVADVAILVVSAEDGVKPQTLEALKLIEGVKIPYIVALTKIDKPSANIEKAKASLLENGVYLEGMGGEVPYVGVSGKSGIGVPELLDLILLAAELEGLQADPSLPGTGVVIEAHIDNKRGATATLIVENGTVEAGEFVVAGEAFAPTRIMEDFASRPVKHGLPGTPVRIIGFSALPQVGAQFTTVETKRDAEEMVAEALRHAQGKRDASSAPVKKELKAETEERVEEEAAPEVTILPIVIKTDVAGVGDAVIHELAKLPKHERLEIRVVSQGVGPITEGDVRFVGSGKTPGIVIGFNVKVERIAHDLAERQGVTIEVFDVIYKLAEWLQTQLEKRRPRERVEEKTGSAKVLKLFGEAKGKVVLGGKVEEGELTEGSEVKVMRRDLELGVGTITSLQSHKKQVKKVEAGAEFGAQVKTSADPAPGDRLEIFTVTLK